MIIPAIDIKDGKVVRLYKGDYDKENVYSDNPINIAKEWVRQGGKLIHIVDLDGAVCGEPKNLNTVKNIVKAINIPVEFGGGVRKEELVKELLDLGVSRVILGTIAFNDRVLLQNLISKYQDKIVVSADVKNDGKIALKGWLEDGGRQSSLVSFVKAISELGVKRIIYTDIERDGTLSGSRFSRLLTYLENLKKLSKYKISVIMAGGISSLKEIEELKKISQEYPELEGVIIGKALYEGKFTLSEALKLS